MPKNPNITFCSGVGTVTGANFLLECGVGSKILIDCGMVQGAKFEEEVNREAFSYEPNSIQALVVTHAHLDHVGRIPKLVKEGFKGVIYSTPQTRALAEIVLTDAAGLLALEAKQDKVAPLYDLADVQAVFPLWQTIPYHQSFEPVLGVSVLFKDAGHILGSVMVEVSVSSKSISSTSLPSPTIALADDKENMSARSSFLGDESDVRQAPILVASEEGSGNEVDEIDGKIMKILFTGDLGNSPAPLLRDTENVGDVDYIVMESVYGDRNHEPKELRTKEFERIIKETIERGGTLVIPAFAIDRTQLLLYELNNMVEQNRIPSVPIFVDSPMAIKATEVYAENTDLFNEQIKNQIGKGDNIFHFPKLEYTMSQNESRDIEKIKGAKIILAGSGMSVGGRVVGHEEFYLQDAKNTILLVGYQSTGSLGRHLAEGAKKVHINTRKIHVRAHIETLYGYSAHRDSDHLVEFVATGTDRLKQVFVVMGEPKSSMHLAQRINEELGVKAIMPERQKCYEL